MIITFEVDSSVAAEHGNPLDFERHVSKTLASIFEKDGLPDQYTRTPKPAPDTVLGLYEAISWLIEYKTEVIIGLKIGYQVVNQLVALYNLYGGTRRAVIIVDGKRLELDKKYRDKESFEKELQEILGKLESKDK